MAGRGGCGRATRVRFGRTAGLGLWLLILIVVGGMVFSACAGAAAPPAATPTAAGTRVVAWAVTPVAAGAAVPTVAVATPKTIATAAPERTPTAASSQPAPAASPQTATAAEDVFAKVSNTRSLTAKAKVPTSFLTREELRPYFNNLLADGQAQEEMAKDQALYVALGLLSDEEDLQELWLGLLGEQVAGLYEFKSQEMKLVSSGGPLSTADELTLAHEYVHALQDQHFAASEKAEQIPDDDDDRALAYLALVEGDATLVQAAYALSYKSKEQLAQAQQQVSAADMAKLAAAPPFLQASLLFPYQQGAAFVAEVFRLGGWPAVNRLYANPPQSTEQILHPRKFLDGEPPVKVTQPNLATALGPSWQSLGSDTFGELGWLVFLLEGVANEQARAAAEGWGGDRIAVFQNGGKYALAALTAWDSINDSQQFLQGVHNVYRARGAKMTTANANRITWTSGAGSGVVVRNGLQVLLVAAPDEATVAKIAGAFTGF